MNLFQKQLKKIKDRRATVGVVGLGYVGLPLAIEFATKGFGVIGFDVHQKRVDQIGRGKSYIKHIDSARILPCVKQGKLKTTTDFSRISETDAVIICVPTPLDEHRNPDISFIEKTAHSIAPHLAPGVLVVLESTTYPGTTEEVMGPILEHDGPRRLGKDLFLAFSPEREDPSNPKYSTSTIPKVVGGMDESSFKLATELYGAVIEQIVPVSSCAVAEATKLLENIFRSVNIALVNEMKMILDRMGIDVWEVIAASSTKPFGFMPFYPGPGLGGHCIPIDPFYLSWKAKEFGINSHFIELAGEINTQMPEYVINKTIFALNEEGKPLRGSKVLIVGVAYKPNVDDLRESPSLELIQRFKELGAEVAYHDPYIPEIMSAGPHSEVGGMKSVPLDNPDAYDVIVIATNHKIVDHARLKQADTLLIDTRNAVGNAAGPARLVKA